MKRKNLLLLLALTACLALAGCKGKDTPDPSVSAGSDDVHSEQTGETAEPEDTGEADAAADENHQGQVRSELTNEWIDESLADVRPIAVMLNNIQVACPQTSISKAGVVYEAPVEGGLTRLMGVIKDWQELQKIGSVRSCREYYVPWALEWDAIYCHFGGPELYVKAILSQDNVHNLDGLALDGSAYYRTSDRKAPHNAYTSGQGILSVLDRYNYPLNHTSAYEGSHYQFSDEDLTLENGMDATKVEPGYPVNKPWFEYNEAEGVYYRYQYGGKQIDDLDGSHLSYKNILIQFTRGRALDANGYLTFEDVDSGQGGYYITNGKAIKITWKKSSQSGITRYYDEAGQEITLNTGKTWVCIVNADSQDAVKIQ